MSRISLDDQLRAAYRARRGESATVPAVDALAGGTLDDHLRAMYRQRRGRGAEAPQAEAVDVAAGEHGPWPEKDPGAQALGFDRGGRPQAPPARIPPAIAAAAGYAGRGLEVSPIEALAMQQARVPHEQQAAALEPFGVEPPAGPGITAEEMTALDRLRSHNIQQQTAAEAQAGEQAGALGRFGANVIAGFGGMLDEAGQQWDRLADLTGSTVPRVDSMAEQLAGLDPQTLASYGAVGGQAGQLSQLGGQLVGSMAGAVTDPISAPLMAVSGAATHAMLKTPAVRSILSQIERKAGRRVATAAERMFAASEGVGMFEGLDEALHWPNWLEDPEGGLRATAAGIALGVVAGGGMGTPGAAAAFAGPGSAPTRAQRLAALDEAQRQQFQQVLRDIEAARTAAPVEAPRTPQETPGLEPTTDAPGVRPVATEPAAAAQRGPETTSPAEAGQVGVSEAPPAPPLTVRRTGEPGAVTPAGGGEAGVNVSQAGLAGNREVQDLARWRLGHRNGRPAQVRRFNQEFDERVGALAAQLGVEPSALRTEVNRQAGELHRGRQAAQGQQFRQEQEHEQRVSEAMGTIDAKLQQGGFVLEHTSDSGSRYYRRGDETVRVSDHLVPQTGERDFAAAARGHAPQWTHELVLDTPRNLAAAVADVDNIAGARRGQEATDAEGQQPEVVPQARAVPPEQGAALPAAVAPQEAGMAEGVGRASKPLNPQQAEVRDRLGALLSDVERADAAYAALPETEGGRVVSTDAARLLAPEFAGSVEGRLLHTPSTSEPTGRFTRGYLLRALDRFKPPDRPGRLYMTAGGAGSGKSTSIRYALRHGADLVYDNQMRNPDEAERAIRAALDRGWHVSVNFVDTPLPEVLRRVIGRSREGRWNSLPDLLEAHRQARAAIAEVGRRFTNEPRVEFAIIDGMTSEATEVTGSELAEGRVRQYTETDDHTAAIESALQAARGDPTLDPAVLARLEGKRPELGLGEAGAQGRQPGAPRGQPRQEGPAPQPGGVAPSTVTADSPYLDIRREAKRLGVLGKGSNTKAALLERIAAATQADPTKLTAEELAGIREALRRPASEQVRDPRVVPVATLESEAPAKPATVEERLAAKEQQILDRMKRRTIPRGRNVGATTLPQDIVDVAMIAALRAARLGIKGGKALADVVSKAAAEVGRAIDTKQAQRVARAILRDATGKDGKIDSEELAAVLEDIAQARPPQRAKAAAEAATGVAKPDRLVSERQALREKMRYSVRVARDVRRAARREQRDIDREKLTAMRDKGEKVRRTAKMVIMTHLPKRLRGAFLTDLTNATTPVRLRRVVDKVARELAMATGRESWAAIRKLTSPKRLKTLTADERAEAVRLRDEARQRLESIETIYAAADSIRDIVQEVRSIYRVNRENRKIRLGEEIRMREEVVADGIKAIESHRPAIRQRADELPGAPRAAWLGRANHGMLTPDTIGAMMGDPTLRRILAEDAWDGETRVFEADQKGEDHLRASLEAAGYTWGSDPLQKLSAEVVGRRKADRITVKLDSGTDLIATPAEIMELYAVHGDSKAGPQLEQVGFMFRRDPNAEAIMVTRQDITRAVEALPAGLKKVVDDAKAFIESEVRPGVFKAHREIKGFDLEAVPGYWRTRRNMGQSDKAFNDTELTMPEQVTRSLQALGFLKERTGGKTPYLIGDFFDSYAEIVHQGSVVAHQTRIVRNAELVFGHPDMIRTIERHFGKHMNVRIQRIINAQKLLFQEPTTMIERSVQVLNRNIARAKLLLNWRTWLKQLGGVGKLHSVMEDEHIRAGLAKLKDMELRARMMASPYFRHRYDSSIFRRVTPSLGERTPLLGSSNTKELMRRALGHADIGAVGEMIDKLPMLNAFDSVAAQVAWGAAESMADAQGLTGAERARFVAQTAERAIRRTQNSSSPLDMSGLAEKYRGSILSPFLQFTSDNNKGWNLLNTAWQTEGVRSRAFRRAAAGVTFNAAFGAAVVALWQWMVDDRDEEKRQTLVDRFARVFAREAGGLPYGGDLVRGLAEVTVDAVFKLRPVKPQHIERDLFSTPLFDVAKQFLAGGVEMVSALGEEGEFKSGPRKGQSKSAETLKSGLDKFWRAGADLLGMPTTPIQDARRVLRALD